MPLRVRLGLVFALGTAVVIAAVGMGFLLQLRHSLEATLDASLRARAEMLSEQVRGDGVRALQVPQDEGPVQLLTGDGRVLATSPSLGGIPVLDPDQRHQLATQLTARPDDPGGTLAFTAGPDDQRLRFVAVAVPGTDQLLVAGTETEIADSADDRVEQGLLLLGPPAVLIAGLGAWWLAGEALRPVEQMRRQTARMSARDDDSHLAVPATRDELAALATTMNGLLDRLRDALRHERGFVADAGHELRTPLATLRAELELAARPGRGIDELREAVAAASGETERVIRLAEDLLLLARGQEAQDFLRPAGLDLVALASAAARAAEVRGAPRGIRIALDAPPRLEVVGDPDRLRQALDNLLANAVHHSPDDRVVDLALHAHPPVEQPSGAPSTATLRVRDRGTGFPVEFLPHAFERFRRADTARARADGGTGLGLAIVHTIVTGHHGTVSAANHPEGGAVVEIQLPLDDPDDLAPEHLASASRRSHSGMPLSSPDPRTSADRGSS